MEKTTIAVTLKTKAHLDKLKIHPREPYDDVINRLLKHNDKVKGGEANGDKTVNRGKR